MKSSSSSSFALSEASRRAIEETQKTFISRDAGILLPQMIKQMSWKRHNERVLDYGCSSGSSGFNYILPHVYLRDSHLYSVDSSERLIAYASMKYSHPTVTYAPGDIMQDNFPFRYIKFDKIFSFYVLQAIKDYKNALNRFYEVLNPSGELGFALITNYFCFKLHQKLGMSERWGKFMEDYDQFIPEFFDRHQVCCKLLIEKCLRVIGFEIVTVESQQLEWKFETIESAIDFYLATSPFTKLIPSALEEEYKRDCVELLREELMQHLDNCNQVHAPGEPCRVKYDIVYAFVRKPGGSDECGSNSSNVSATQKITKVLKRRSRFSLP